MVLDLTTADWVASPWVQAGSVLRHEFVRRLQARYRNEEIIIPYPIRTPDLPPGQPGGPQDLSGRGAGRTRDMP